MRRSKTRPVLIIGWLAIWLIVVPIAFAQDPPNNWQPLSGPGGRISQLTASADGQQLYAVSMSYVNRRDDQTQWRDSGALYRADAIYHSADAGATWRPATNDLPPGPISALYLDPRQGVLYAAVQGSGAEFSPHDGLWRSADQGAHWEPVTLDRNDLRIRRILRRGDSLLLAAIDAGAPPSSYLYRMETDGRWTSTQILLSEQQPAGVLADLTAHPKVADRLFVTADNGDLYVSENNGRSWSSAQVQASQALSGTAALLAFSPDNPDTALLVQSYGAEKTSVLIRRSTDGGLHWRVLAASGLPSDGEPQALIALPGDTYLLNTAAGTSRSTDGGKTWQPLEGALSSGGVSTFLMPASGSAAQAKTVMAATGYGVFISRDAAASYAAAIWQASGAGLPFNSKIAGLLTHPSRPEQVFAISDNRIRGVALPPAVLRSLDGGKHWAPAAQGLPDAAASYAAASYAAITAWAIDPIDPDTLLLASPEHLLLSTDAGVSWQVTRMAASPRAAIAFAPSDANTIYVAGRPASRSTDHGATWQDMPIPTADPTQQTEEVTALAVHPRDPQRLWAALTNTVYESRDGGRTWLALPPLSRPVQWLTAVTDSADSTAVTLYAGVTGDGIHRWDGAAQDTAAWTSVSAGLPAQSTITAFIADVQNGVLWAARDGGGIYRSTDAAASWANAAAGLGDNLVQALSINYSEPGGVLIGAATAGVWKLTANPALSAAPTAAATPAQPAASRAGIDARIEIVWPHDWAAVSEAKLANIGLRLFQPGSLQQPPCGWRPRVTVWQAVNTEPAAPLALAEQRTIDGQPFPYWELNDVEVGSANPSVPADAPGRKLYFMVRVEGADTATSIWAHGTDPRTYLPQPEVPSGIATGAIDAVDARILIVWPHDAQGERAITEAPMANVSVALFKHGTRLSVPLGWRPAGVSLLGAWNQEVGKPLADQAEVISRQAGAITYPTWEFNNIPVTRAADPRDKLYLWVDVAGVETYPSIWAHGADSRTVFPIRDEPIQGCVP